MNEIVASPTAAVRPPLVIAQLPLGAGSRTVRVSLPVGYSESDTTYPVIYMFDGQNLFDPSTATYGKSWDLGRVMGRLTSEDPDLAAVIVGIDSPDDKLDRCADYTVWDWTFRLRPEADDGRPIIATGRETAAWLLEAVKPWAEHTFRIHHDPEFVTIAGSSLGGYMSLYTEARFPGQFGSVLAFSPAVLDFPMHGDRLRAFLANRAAPHPARIYLDMGDAEDLEYIEDSQVLVTSLSPLVTSLQVSGHSEIAVRVVPGAGHDEPAWGARFADAYRWARTGIAAFGFQSE